MSDIITDVRCPTGTTSLLGKLVFTDPDRAQSLDLEPLMLQLHCRSCTQDARRLYSDDSVVRVLHLFTLTGLFQHTVIQFKDREDQEVSPESQRRIYELSMLLKGGSIKEDVVPPILL